MLSSGSSLPLQGWSQLTELVFSPGLLWWLRVLTAPADSSALHSEGLSVRRVGEDGLGFEEACSALSPPLRGSSQLTLCGSWEASPAAAVWALSSGRRGCALASPLLVGCPGTEGRVAGTSCGRSCQSGHFSLTDSVVEDSHPPRKEATSKQPGASWQILMGSQHSRRCPLFCSGVSHHPAAHLSCWGGH